MNREVNTRRRLPHWYVPEAAYFVTHRLAGTLPARVRTQRAISRRERAAGTAVGQHRTRAHGLLFADFDNWLDNYRQLDWLADAHLATIVRSHLYHHHGSTYHLMVYCVMPNHVHIVLQPILTSPTTTVEMSRPAANEARASVLCPVSSTA